MILREIITKAVYGRGKGEARGVVTFPNLGSVKKVLGSTATEFKVQDVTLRTRETGITAAATGQFYVHVWYLAGEDTAVSKQSVSATVEIPVDALGREQFTDLNVSVSVVKQPRCGEVSITGNGDCLEVEVEAILMAEVSGETKLRLAPPPAETEDTVRSTPRPRICEDGGHDDTGDSGNT